MLLDWFSAMLKINRKRRRYERQQCGKSSLRCYRLRDADVGYDCLVFGLIEMLNKRSIAYLLPEAGKNYLCGIHLS